MALAATALRSQSRKHLPDTSKSHTRTQSTTMPEQLDPVSIQLIVQSSQAVISDAIRVLPSILGFFHKKEELKALSTKLESARELLGRYQALANMNHSSVSFIDELNRTWGMLDKAKEHLQAVYGAYVAWSAGGQDAAILQSIISRFASTLNDAQKELGVVVGNMPAIFQSHKDDVRRFMSFHARDAQSLQLCSENFQRGVETLINDLHQAMEQIAINDIDGAMSFFQVAPVSRFKKVLEPLTEVRTIVMQSLQNQFIYASAGAK